MSEDETELTGLGLQFDRAVKTGASSDAAQPAVVCAGCQRAIETEYFDINGRNVCAPCRDMVEAASECPRGLGVLLRAALFGAGAAVLGAAIYYAVLAIAHLEIGLIAILSGYMIGTAVRTGANGRGGLRFQILALLLTYLSVAMAYTPVVIQGIRNDRAESRTQASATTNGGLAAQAPSTHAAPPRANAFGCATGGIVLAGLFAALPVMVVFGGLPTSLIGGLIIGFGMRQAWRMTGAPTLTIFGPYRVGTTPAATL